MRVVCSIIDNLNKTTFTVFCPQVAFWLFGAINQSISQTAVASVIDGYETVQLTRLSFVHIIALSPAVCKGVGRPL